MKKIYVFVFICTWVLSMRAQYTITSASNPLQGDIEQYFYLDTTGLILGTNGTGQYWDYSGATVNGSIAIMSNTYVPMSSVPNNSMFPGATIAADDGSGNYSVYSNNSTKTELIGIASPTAVGYIVFSDPSTSPLPVFYGSVNSDTYSYSVPGYSVSGSYTTTGAGTGTLQLFGVAGAYPNVLKIRVAYQYTATSTSGVTSSNGVQDSYYASASKFPLLIVGSYTTSSISGTNTTVSYSKQGRINTSQLGAVNEKQTEFSQFIVFPNPNINGNVNLTFNLNTSENCELIVYNSLGQIVRSFTYSGLSTGTNRKNIGLDDLESGIYFLKLKTGTSEQIRRLAISR